MGKKAREILKIDADKLIEQLNKALADEWFAYYQYWVGAQIVVGPMQSAAQAELTQHAADELRHAGMLTARIIQLDGTPILDPNDWKKMANCAYLKPKDFHDKAIIKQGLEGERCAIDVYNKLLAMVKDKDEISYQMILEILKDEIEHENDFETLLEDMK